MSEYYVSGDNLAGKNIIKAYEELIDDLKINDLNQFTLNSVKPFFAKHFYAVIDKTIQNHLNVLREMNKIKLVNNGVYELVKDKKK